MRKKELEKLKKPLAADELLKMAGEDKGEFIRYSHHFNNDPENGYVKYRHHRYFMAAVEGGYLVVGMFLRKDLVAGEREACMYLYFSKDDFITYDVRKGKWSAAKIDMLDYDREPGQRQEDFAYSRKRDEQCVNDFFGYEKKKLETAVFDFQCSVRKEKVRLKQKRETDRIDRVMECVPEIPAGFLAWVEGDGTYGSRYIFYHAEERGRAKSGRCSCCGADVMIEKPKRGEQRKCPSCGRAAFLHSWNQGKSVQDTAVVGLIQKMTDGSGIVVRRFQIEKSYYRENEWKHFTGWREDVRETYSMELHTRGHYEYGQFRSTGISRWCTTANEPAMKNWYKDGYYFDDARFYPGNIRQLRKGTIFQYVPLEGILRKNPGKYIKKDALLWTIKTRPQIEYLYKMKLYRLAGQYLNEEFELGQGRKPWEKLTITKEQLEDCIRHNAGWADVKIMQQLTELGYRASWQDTEWLKENVTGAGIRTLLPGTTIHRLKRYLKAQQRENETNRAVLLQEYIDYMDMARKLDWDIQDEFIRFPRKLEEAHDNAAELINERREELARLEQDKKDAAYEKLLPRMKELYGYEDDAYKIVIPEKKADFIAEGQEQHNCVGGVYFDRVLERESVVLFLRKKEDIEKSYCTVEMKGFEIKQCYEAYNRPAGEETKKWMEQYVKKIEKREQKRLEGRRKEKEARQRIAVAV